MKCGNIHTLSAHLQVTHVDLMIVQEACNGFLIQIEPPNVHNVQ